MALTLLDQSLKFPDPAFASSKGLLAIGGDLTTERLLLAYRSGIFPWYSEGEPIHWWSPDPRMVLNPDELKISKSMHQVLKRETFRITFNTSFNKVIESCAKISRPHQPGTWIVPEMMEAYRRLHQLGYAHSVEAWLGNELVGGLYGVYLGKVFFGESMFSTVSNASKAAFLSFIRQEIKNGLKLVDCQVYTEHLESLGARLIPREKFLQLLAKNI